LEHGLAETARWARTSARYIRAPVPVANRTRHRGAEVFPMVAGSAATSPRQARSASIRPAAGAGRARAWIFGSASWHVGYEQIV
jgi:hypothetical protein